MSIPLPFINQYECRNEILPVYASDRRGIVDYQFNNLGYRNDIDYIDNSKGMGVYIGSSITAGIGIPWSNTFAKLSSDMLSVECYQFSQGCTPVDNQEILRLLKQLKQSNISPRYYVLQFINLDRRYNSITGTLAINTSENENIKLFMDTFNQIQALLTSDVWCFLGSDSHNYNCHSMVKDHPNCVTWNPTFIDQAGVGTHPGIKWHKMLSLAITKKLQKQLM